MGRYVIRAQYWNPADDSVAASQLVSEADLRILFDRILELMRRPRMRLPLRPKRRT